ncbi:NAD-glutamate dehydrogenase [Rhodococcus opacus]|nr:NAD-glutamate dehydrogenase [Rhodococcus opacus]
MGNGASTADQLTSPLAVDVNEAIGRLLLTSSDRSDTPRMVFLCDLARDATVEAVILWPGTTPLLADVATMFEHFGLRVADRDTLPLPADLSGSAALHKFTFRAPQVWQSRSLSLVSEAFEAHALHGFEIDDYAKLILTAGLSWRDIVLVRAASRFVRQAGLGLSEHYVTDTCCCGTPSSPSPSWRYFGARFDPELDDRDAVIADAAADVHEHLDAATTLDEDRIMRSLESFVTACLRTNWYQLDGAGTPKPYSSFKLDSSKLALTGPVVPYREIYVYANDVEGIHLRSGAVARVGCGSPTAPRTTAPKCWIDEDPDGEELPIVPVGAQGCLRSQEPGYQPRRGVYDVHPRPVGCHRQHRRWSHRRTAAHCHLRRPRHLPRGGRR